MPKQSEQRRELIIYWNRHRYEMSQERSIKAVYIHYKEYTIEKDIPLTQEYRFREYIRKNGYCNSCGGEEKCKRCVKNKDKKL